MGLDFIPCPTILISLFVYVFYPMVLLSQTQIPGQTALSAKFQNRLHFGGQTICSHENYVGGQRVPHKVITLYHSRN